MLCGCYVIFVIRLTSIFRHGNIYSFCRYYRGTKMITKLSDEIEMQKYFHSSFLKVTYVCVRRDFNMNIAFFRIVVSRNVQKEIFSEKKV